MSTPQKTVSGNFYDPLSDYFSIKCLLTNLATFWADPNQHFLVNELSLGFSSLDWLCSLSRGEKEHSHLTNHRSDRNVDELYMCVPNDQIN